MSPRLQLVTEPTDERVGPLAVDATSEGAVLALSPVAAVEVATALIQAGTPEQFARITAASCHHAAGGTGVAVLAALLMGHARINVDRADLTGLVDELDDALHATPTDPNLPDDRYDAAADARKDDLL